MNLYIDVGQVGMSRGEFEKAGSPCWQQPLPCPGTKQSSGGDVLGRSSLYCFFPQEQLFQAYLDYDHNERGFLVGRTSPGGVALDV